MSDEGELRIVVGVDGSPCATRALDYATHLAAHTGALLPAEDTLMIPMGLIEEAAAGVVRESLERVGQIEPSVIAKGECLFGAPGPVLAESSGSSSQLVVGTRGLGYVAGALLGSVSDYVVHRASCTTTVVR
jgi:nucleotide-binding universal stress UspA family protein